MFKSELGQKRESWCAADSSCVPVVEVKYVLPLQFFSFTLDTKNVDANVCPYVKLTQRLRVLLASPFLAVFSRCGTSEKK